MHSVSMRRFGEVSAPAASAAGRCQHFGEGTGREQKHSVLRLCFGTVAVVC
jgi:hypothetical protein